MVEVNDKRYKLQLSAIIAFTYFAYVTKFIESFNYNTLGPTLNDLQHSLAVDNVQISYLFITRAGLYFLGAIFCNYILMFTKMLNFNKLNDLSWMDVHMGFTPQMSKLWEVLLLQSMFGFVSGGIDIASNVLMLEMWQKESNRYLQGVHLCYAIGATAAPLVSSQFLEYQNSNNSSLFYFRTLKFDKKGAENSQLEIPFAITGITAIIAAIIIFAFEIMKPYKIPERCLTRKNDENCTYYVTFVTIAALMSCGYPGLELNTFGYLPTFLTRINLGISDQESSFMTATMAAAYMSLRIIGVFVANKMKTTIILGTSFVVVVIANLLILFVGANSYSLMWPCLILLGLGFSMVLPSLFTYSEERIDVTNAIAGLFIFASSGIPSTSPLLIGKLIKTEPLVFCYLNVSLAIAVLLLFIAATFLDFWKHKFLKTNN
ncbi:sodium-dependent glucose transporter 1-like protein [Leptotrombidium deliense]|uniref:Sodium-dependent glucose transporter 1-like protein n=1 Tax=Leptotrombidium deliense TaxID=299467 RepID=A0A443SCN7_9ACAR|nr:sodium-dependent glucose transporter 1-like protein [Leptotrombidium deliense]